MARKARKRSRRAVRALVAGTALVGAAEGIRRWRKRASTAV